MRKVLIMLGTYHPTPLANGVCIHQIALELQKKGYEVHIMCMSNDKFNIEIIQDGLHIYPVKRRFFYKIREKGERNLNSKRGRFYYNLAMLLNKIKKIMYIPLYPMTSPVFMYRYYKLGLSLHKKNAFDAIIAVYNPLEAIVVGSLLKKKFPNIKLFHYFLDSLTNDGGVRYLPKWWTRKMGFKWERRVYKDADIILKMKCHEKHYNQKEYLLYNEKMRFVDIPLYIKPSENKKAETNVFESDYIDWVYAGSLTSGTYDAEYACLIFSEIIKKENNHKLHFYSRGNFENRIQEFSDKTKGAIVRHGFIERNALKQALCSASLLVSVGTSNSDMIPSKIFEYISSGKPIIHFYTQDKDVCIPYYEKYPLALCIKQDYKEMDNNVVRILDFIKSTKNKTVDQNEIERYFIKNTPKYTVDLIDADIE